MRTERRGRIFYDENRNNEEWNKLHKIYKSKTNELLTQVYESIQKKFEVGDVNLDNLRKEGIKEVKDVGWKTAERWTRREDKFECIQKVKRKKCTRSVAMTAGIIQMYGSG